MANFKVLKAQARFVISIWLPDSTWSGDQVCSPRKCMMRKRLLWPLVWRLKTQAKDIAEHVRAVDDAV